MKLIHVDKHAQINNGDFYTVIQTHNDMYAVWSSCNSRKKGVAGRKTGSTTKTNKRVDNLSNLKHTFKRNRDLINTNFDGGSSNLLFITLTYADRTIKGKDGAKQVNKDFDKFIKKLKYSTYYGNVKRGTKNLAWFSALEPQASGVWHLHCILQWKDREKIFIPNFKLSTMWGHGFVKVNRIKDVSNIGAYLSAYLTNVIIDPENASKSKKETKWTRKHEHMVEKGSRLPMYPAGIRLCRHSRNLKNPKKQVMTGLDLKFLILHEGWKNTFSITKEFELDQEKKEPTEEQQNMNKTNIIEIKQFYFVADHSIPERYKTLKKLAQIKATPVSKLLRSMGYNSLLDFTQK